MLPVADWRSLYYRPDMRGLIHRACHMEVAASSEKPFCMRCAAQGRSPALHIARNSPSCYVLARVKVITVRYFSATNILYSASLTEL